MARLFDGTAHPTGAIASTMTVPDAAAAALSVELCYTITASVEWCGPARAPRASRVWRAKLIPLALSTACPELPSVPPTGTYALPSATRARARSHLRHATPRHALRVSAWRGN